MSIRIKQLSLRLLIGVVQTIRFLARATWWVMLILLSPAYIAIRWILRPVIIFGYTQYLKVMARLRRSAFMQNRVLFIFGNKYFIHVIVVMMAFFVTSTNMLQAQTVANEDVFAKDSALYNLVSDGNQFDEEIVQTGLIPEQKTTVSYIDTDGNMMATISNIDPSGQPARSNTSQFALLDAGSAVVSTSALQTNAGVRSGTSEYKVKDGESIGGIADRFGISVNTVLWANSLTSSSTIRPGQTLKIPAESGVLYTVKSGDTLDSIISKYSADKDKTVKLNDIGSDGTIPVGSEILLAGGTPPAPPAPVATTSYIANRTSSGSSAYQPSNLPANVTAGQFNYPVGCRGAMTTYWGHAGRGRDLPCPFGTPIYAATDGVARISFTGSWGSGYGNAIDISSGNIMTRYAHMNAFAIQSGQYVTRGQVIGYVGMTGRTSGPHLHFEIHINGAAVDPINYLR